MNPVFLRALEPEDLALTWRWHNDPELYATLGGSFRFVSQQAEAEWLRAKSTPSSNQVNLAICESASTEHVGNAYLRDIDWIHRHAELHLFIGSETMRGKGYGQAATRLLIQHAFDDLNLHRVYLFVLADNARAIRAYEKCGFQIEGQLRQHVFKHGTFVDMILMGLCRA